MSRTANDLAAIRRYEGEAAYQRALAEQDDKVVPLKAPSTADDAA
jgi:hypothetical protein